MCDIELRILKLLKSEKDLNGRGYWKQLEAFSDIPSSRWCATFAFRQKPTLEMLDILCRKYPQHALWICTGTSNAPPFQETPYLGGVSSTELDHLKITSISSSK